MYYSILKAKNFLSFLFLEIVSILWAHIIENVFHGPVILGLPGSLLETQNLRPIPKTAE